MTLLSRFLNAYQRHAARRMFSRWSPIYEDEVSENSYSAADEVAKVSIRHLARANIQNPAIADIGIGTGLLAQQIYDSLPCRITGLDFSEDMMSACAGRGITELLVKCDVGRDFWPLESGTQDAVVSAGLMEYLTPGMLQHFATEAARILQQKGMLIFTYMPQKTGTKQISFWQGHSGTYLICGYGEAEIETAVKRSNFALLEHSQPFKGCVFGDGSSYDYRLIVAQKT
jgi:predicted TPR repeat methyltransferase